MSHKYVIEFVNSINFPRLKTAMPIASSWLPAHSSSFHLQHQIEDKIGKIGFYFTLHFSDCKTKPVHPMGSFLLFQVLWKF